jgi:hypothetical protein
MSFNLTSQQIKDTYEQLVQVSGSAIVDGTGSLVNAFDYPSNSTYNSFSSSVASTLSTIVAGSGSADWALITNKPAGLVSGSSQVIYSQITGVPSGILSSSSQIASEISGAFTSTSASLAAGIATNKSDITTKLATSTFTSYSSSVSTRLTTDEANIATQTSRVDSLVAATSSYAVLSSNNNFSGTQTFDNIAVNGTASIGHVEQVTGSAVIIGEQFIILNAATPTARYAGIKIYDTGSTNATASLEWDGVQDTWILMEESGDTAVILTGMTGSRGSEVFPTLNTIQKGGGFNQLTDSNISDDGSQVSITGPVSASTYYGDGSNLTGISAGLISATGSYSIQSSPSLVTPRATFVSSSGAIGIGSVMVTGEESVAIGYVVTASRENSVAIGNFVRQTGSGRGVTIGYNISSSGQDSVVLGRDNNVSGDNSVAIGLNADAGTDGIAIGYNVDSADYATAIGYNIYNGGGGGNIAIGRNVSIANDYTIAIGENSTANASLGVAIGYLATTDGSTNSTAIGANAGAQNGYATAIGESARANNDASIAIGAQVQASSNQAIAIGTEADVLGSSVGAIAIGQGAQVTGTQAIGIGQGVSTSTDYEINIGNRFKFDGVASIFLSGSVTGSGGFSGDGSGLTNVTALSASYAQTSSFAAGNFEVAGQMFSPTFAGSVASSTSSIDFDNGNFATLSLTSGTHLANPSNLNSGTTYTIITTSGSLVSGYGSAFKFAGGTLPTLSNGTDVLTMVSDGTSLYATALADFQ